MEVLNTVDLIGSVNGESNTIEALATDNTSEAMRMIRTTGSP